MNMENEPEASRPSASTPNPSRRDFIRTGAGVTLMASTGGLTGLLEKTDSPALPEKTFINGIQVSADSFMDEGVEKVLDIFQERGALNTIFVSTFSYDRGITGRQMPGEPLPDHGAREYDTNYFHGGFYATPHARFYEHTALKGDRMRAPDFGRTDILADVIPSAKKRGLKIFASIQDGFDYPDDVPGMKEFAEINLSGVKGPALCFYKPDVQAFWVAVATDICSSYPVDGVLLFNERNGPLLDVLGASHGANFADSVTCFCPDHEREAKAHGIDFRRAKEGYTRLGEFVARSRKGERPSDGYYVAFERLMLAYPEIMAYHQLFDQGKHAVLAKIRAAVKAVKSSLQVGFHIEHVNSFNPYYRATRDYEDLAGKADFLKVVAYNNCAGERYVRFINNIQSTIYRDVPAEELMRFNNHLLNYGQEASLKDLPAAGFSPDYVYRETQRAMNGVNGKCRILPGIDIGIPTAAGSRKASPEDTYAATLAAFRAGADGVLLSRKYSEMKLANLDAAGRAIREGMKGMR